MVSAIPTQAGAATALPQPVPQAAAKSRSLPAWLEVAKPRLIPLLLATTAGGMALTPSDLQGWDRGLTVAATMLGGSLAAASAGVLNCIWEQELDGRMVRTSRRALPAGRLNQERAFALAALLTTAAVVVLVLAVNALAALHGSSQAPHQPEHRDRRGGRRHSTAGGCGGPQRSTGLGQLVALLAGDGVDTSPLLGPGPALAR